MTRTATSSGREASSMPPRAAGLGAGPPSRDYSGSPPAQVELAKATLQARAALEDVATAAATAAASALSLAEVLDEALAVLEGDPGPIDETDRSGPRAVLSPREREVLVLVTAGHSNKAIAEALFVSPNTVKTHVASLMNKLHAGSRVQLAAIATRRALA